MYRWDLDIISSLVLMMTAMSHVVVRFLFVTLLGVQGHPREGIAKSLQGMVVKHANIMIVNVSMSTVACGFIMVGCLGLWLHLEDKITSLGVGIVCVEDT